MNENVPLLTTNEKPRYTLQTHDNISTRIIRKNLPTQNKYCNICTKFYPDHKTNDLKNTLDSATFKKMNTILQNIK